MFDQDLGSLSWQLFSSTGQIGYYLLYKRLTEEDEVNPPTKRTKFD
ncbi:MAG TPA: YqzL family protein [Clostridia bacterium]